MHVTAIAKSAGVNSRCCCQKRLISPSRLALVPILAEAQTARRMRRHSCDRISAAPYVRSRTPRVRRSSNRVCPGDAEGRGRGDRASRVLLCCRAGSSAGGCLIWNRAALRIVDRPSRALRFKLTDHSRSAIPLLRDRGICAELKLDQKSESLLNSRGAAEPVMLSGLRAPRTAEPLQPQELDARIAVLRRPTKGLPRCAVP